MTDALKMENVVVAPHGTPLLRDIQLEVGPGDFIALLGPNGAGKSTLIRTALGLMELAEGRVRIGEQDVGTMDGKTRASHLCWLPQKSGIYETIKVLDFVAASRYRFSESRASAIQAASEYLVRCKASALADRSIDTLSGGESQRVAFAALLAQEAQIALLDEPANHLDPVNQFQLYGLLGEHWARGHGVVCITHDINLLNHVCSADKAGSIQVCGIADGRIQFRHPFTDPDLSQALAGLFGVHVSMLKNEGRTHFVCSGGPSGAPS